MDAYYLYGMGLEQYEQGNYSKAIEYFEQSNAIEEHFKTYERLFECWKKLGKTEKANSCIEIAYRMNPRNDKTAFEYAEMLAGSGDTERALAVLDEISERNPSCKKAREFAEHIIGSNEDGNRNFRSYDREDERIAVIFNGTAI